MAQQKEVPILRQLSELHAQVESMVSALGSAHKRIDGHDAALYGEPVLPSAIEPVVYGQAVAAPTNYATADLVTSLAAQIGDLQAQLAELTARKPRRQSRRRKLANADATTSRAARKPRARR